MSKLLGCELDSLDEGVMLGASSGDVECHDADGSGALPSGSSSSASRAPVKKQQREERFEPSALDLKLKINLLEKAALEKFAKREKKLAVSQHIQILLHKTVKTVFLTFFEIFS